MSKLLRLRSTEQMLLFILFAWKLWILVYLCFVVLREITKTRSFILQKNDQLTPCRYVPFLHYIVLNFLKWELVNCDQQEQAIANIVEGKWLELLMSAEYYIDSTNKFILKN